MGGQYYNGHKVNMVGDCGLDTSGTGHGHVAGSCEHGNELSGSINGVEFE